MRVGGWVAPPGDSLSGGGASEGGVQGGKPRRGRRGAPFATTTTAVRAGGGSLSKMTAAWRATRSPFLNRLAGRVTRRAPYRFMRGVRAARRAARARRAREVRRGTSRSRLLVKIAGLLWCASVLAIARFERPAHLIGRSRRAAGLARRVPPAWPSVHARSRPGARRIQTKTAAWRALRRRRADREARDARPSFQATARGVGPGGRRARPRAGLHDGRQARPGRGAIPAHSAGPPAGS